MDNQKLGIFITELRKEKGLTQAQLAQKLNVTDKAVSKWERGVGFPDIKLLEPLADVLDISLLELMKSERLPKTTVSAPDTTADHAPRSDRSRIRGWKEKKTRSGCRRRKHLPVAARKVPR